MAEATGDTYLVRATTTCMSITRSLILRASRSQLLGRQLPRRAFVRRAVRRFIPGEDVSDALGAAARLAVDGIGSLYTRLGENVTSMTDVEAEVAHYSEVIARVATLGLPAWPSIKLTHLGLDIDASACERNLLDLAAHAGAHGAFLWIDMEDSSYVDATLAMFERVRARHDRVGVCLQAYLRRTQADVERLLPMSPAIRLVKGAYAESPDVAYPRKRDVDARYLALAIRLLESAARGAAFPVFGTHDSQIIAALREHAGDLGVASGAYEFHLLYGIAMDEQRALARSGESLRVLISYGKDWFPWYMRRLAERPANLWFAARQLVG